MLTQLPWLQMTFPIRPDRVQDSSHNFGRSTLVGGKLAEPLPPAARPAEHAANLSAARAPDMPGPGSELPPLPWPQGGRPEQAPKDFLHLFGKKAGKLPVESG